MFYRGLFTGLQWPRAPKRIPICSRPQKNLIISKNNTEERKSAVTDISYLNVPIYQMDKLIKLRSGPTPGPNRSNSFIHYNTDAVAMKVLEGSCEPLALSLNGSSSGGNAYNWIGPFFYNRLGYYT